MTKPLLQVLRGESVKPPPIWLMRQAGRYLPEYQALRRRSASFLEFCYSPELAAEATLQPIRRFGLDAAIVFSDILVIPDALGQPVWFVEGTGPRLEALRTGEDVARLSADGLAEHLASVGAMIAQVRASLDEEVGVIGFAGAPWTIATYMIEGGASRDFATCKRWAMVDPHGFAKLIDLLVEVIAAHLVAQVEAGADALQIFDSWASVLPDGEFERWVIAPTLRIVERVKTACPTTPVIGFPRAAGLRYRAYAEQTGVDAVSIDAGVPIGWAARELQPICAVQGNLDPVALLAGGDALATAARSIRNGLSGGPFIFNLGHGVLPATPPDHVGQLVELVRGLAADRLPAAARR